MRGIFQDFLKNTKSVFWGRNLLWHLLAIALTFALVISGFDWRYFQLTRSPVLRPFFWPAVELGAFTPLFGILIFYVISAAKKNSQAVNIALALGQAALLGLLTSDFYKFFTGRPGLPGFLTQNFTTDISHVFRFGILRGGLFFGWPSSHTVVAFAMAVTLIYLFPKNEAPQTKTQNTNLPLVGSGIPRSRKESTLTNILHSWFSAKGDKLVRYLAIFYAFYIGIGVSVTIHWFSDFAAGAIIGTAIGTIVGKSFRERTEKNI